MSPSGDSPAPAKRRRTLRDEFTDLPNLLTMLRIVMIPFVLVFIDNTSPARSFLASVIFALAAITDSLDGYLARKRGEVSVLGKFLDPLADKLIVTAVMVIMVSLDRLPAWLVVVLLGRELAITGLRGIASSEGLVIAASETGRHKTALQLAGLIALLIHFKYDIVGLGIRIDFHLAGLWVIYLSLFFSIFSAVEYLKLFGSAVVDQGRARS